MDNRGDEWVGEGELVGQHFEGLFIEVFGRDCQDKFSNFLSRD